ncbi:hypothetical protein B0H17DRAFT_1200430 [Mycena rosella]|uniref:Cellobiose dehydrogenase cytochrome domain-containing protein n=1 Tax=Mycena rosella TaxID=1033263 RepID=A0AAD7DJE1_MYCRO|nr:hypothetical protein B0H17DRAFT_1200430 [Mycena rosella]
MSLFQSFGPLLAALALLFTFPVTVNAALTNLTIDDANSTFFTHPCAGCSAQPGTVEIYDQTWHDGNNGSSGTFTFQGTEVYIYGIDLADPVNISPTMEAAADAFHYYAGSDQFVFNSLFYHAANLSGGANHTVSWTLHGTKKMGRARSSTTLSMASASTSIKSHTGSIAGGVVGAVGSALLIGVGLFFLLRQRKKARENALGDAEHKTHPIRVRTNYVVPFTTHAPARNSNSDDDGGTSPVQSAMSPVASKQYETGWPRPPGAVDEHAPVRAPHGALELPGGESTMASSARERFLEDRLAILEAHVNQHLPPPYEHSGSQE